jgi:bifunctional non-homologous end joining protein LigD
MVAGLVSRNGADYTRRFAEVTEAVAAVKPSQFHFDAELVAMDPQGRPSFQTLQGRGPLPNGWRFGLYAFDLLAIEGRDLRGEPLSERRARLEDIVTGRTIRFSHTLNGRRRSGENTN